MQSLENTFILCNSHYKKFLFKLIIELKNLFLRKRNLKQNEEDDEEDDYKDEDLFMESLSCVIQVNSLSKLVLKVISDLNLGILI